MTSLDMRAKADRKLNSVVQVTQEKVPYKWQDMQWLWQDQPFQTVFRLMQRQWQGQ